MSTISHYFKPKHSDQRGKRTAIASETLEAIDKGSYTLNGITYPLEIETMNRGTKYFAPDSLLSGWKNAPSNSSSRKTEISVLELPTLQGARYIASSMTPESKGTIGILNFASAKNPGGGFLRGAQAQEESIARSSTLYPSLMTDTAQAFYSYHKLRLHNFYYSHAMIYSPRVIVFRDEDGKWVEPLEVDVLTSPAVNAGELRKNMKESDSESEMEEKIEKVMEERMARILYLYETRGVTNIVLGSFGTGVFRNSVEMVVRLWAKLLVGSDARFRQSFDRVVFAVIGPRGTFDKFKSLSKANRPGVSS